MITEERLEVTNEEDEAFRQIMQQIVQRNDELNDANSRLAEENQRLQCPEVEVMLMHPKARIPMRGSDGAAGFDLYCIERIDIPAGRQAKLPTGVAVSVPAGWYGRVAPRSGLAVKHGINVHAGVIDSDFIGDLHVCLINHGDDLVEFKPGDRIAQLIIERCSTGPMVAVEYLGETQRGSRGFGSTGR